MSIIGLGLISLLPTDVLTNVFIIITIYILLNVAYCLHLKKYAILDVFIIAIGFVMRVIAGGTATSIWVTHWIVLMTFLLSLFLSFAKRRDDVILFSETGMQPRKNTNRYNLDFINQALTIVGSITMVCYIMYTVSPEVIERMGTKYLYLTSLFVLAGIIRYMQLTIVDDKSGSPTKILIKDRFIQLCIIGWAVAFFIILYVI
jgi:4-hydroxybenzoate polyprenyltransferase